MSEEQQIDLLAYYHISHSQAEVQTALSIPMTLNQSILVKSLDSKSLFTKDLKVKKKQNETTRMIKKEMIKNGATKESIDFWFS